MDWQKINLCLLAFIFLTGINLKCFSQENSVRLKPEFSFGHQGYQLLINPVHFATDRDKSIYIADHHAPGVFEYNIEGDYVKNFGREGRGPGEYVNPKAIETDEKKLYVHDVANKRLLIFDLNSDSSEVVYINRDLVEFDTQEDKLFAFAPINFLAEASIEDEQLITVFDKNGERLTSFGKYLTFVDGMPSGMSWPKIETENGLIHIAFTYFPYYRVYTADGELLFEINLSDISGIQDPVKNYREKNYKRGAKGFSGVIRGMDVYDNRVFISRESKSVFIDEFEFENNNLTHVRSYKHERPSDEYNYVLDFFYHEESNAFYILETNGVPKVTVYSLPQ